MDRSKLFFFSFAMVALIDLVTGMFFKKNSLNHENMATDRFCEEQNAGCQLAAAKMSEWTRYMQFREETPTILFRVDYSNLMMTDLNPYK